MRPRSTAAASNPPLRGRRKGTSEHRARLEGNPLEIEAEGQNLRGGRSRLQPVKEMVMRRTVLPRNERCDRANAARAHRAWSLRRLIIQIFQPAEIVAGVPEASDAKPSGQHHPWKPVRAKAWRAVINSNTTGHSAPPISSSSGRTTESRRTDPVERSVADDGRAATQHCGGIGH